MLKIATILFLVTITLTQCPNDPYCLNCENSKCEVCIYSYLDVKANKCIPTNKVEHCTSYSDENTCINCAPRYYLDNNKCLAIPNKDCIIAQKVVDNVSGQNISAIVCLACADKMLITNGECSAEHLCQQTHCRTCSRGANNSEVCIRCEDDFVMNPLTGECRTQVMKGCLALDDKDTSACGECVPGTYSTVNDTCAVTDAYDSTKDFDTKSSTTDNKASTDKSDKNTPADEDEFSGINIVAMIAVVAVLFK